MGKRLTKKEKDIIHKLAPLYHMSIAWSPEDDCFVVRFPEIKGCITHGDTHEEAMAKGKEALIGHLEAMKSNGIEIPEPVSKKKFSGKFMARLDPEDHKKLALEAAQLGVSISELARRKLSA